MTVATTATTTVSNALISVVAATASSNRWTYGLTRRFLVLVLVDHRRQICTTTARTVPTTIGQSTKAYGPPGSGFATSAAFVVVGSSSLLVSSSYCCVCDGSCPELIATTDTSAVTGATTTTRTMIMSWITLCMHTTPSASSSRYR